MVTDEYILSSDNLNVYYGNFQALANVSIKIKPNIVTALIGPSGCGKSTLLRCFNRMNDLIPIFSLDGSIKYKSQELYDDTTDATNIRSQIGMVFQKPNPFPKSIYDNVAFGLKINGYTGNYDEQLKIHYEEQRCGKKLKTGSTKVQLVYLVVSNKDFV